MAPKDKTARRTSGAMRAAYFAMGAFTLLFDLAKAWLASGNATNDAASKKRSHNYKQKVLNGADREARSEPYRAMERKGFRITSDTGCWIPEDHYCTRSGGDIFKGYQRSFFAVNGFMPKQVTDVPRDDKGRDISAQISHLCHRHYCCRPDHLCYEYKWRNFVRNGCLGPCQYLGQSTCGCMLQYILFGQHVQHGPPCLRAYEPSADKPPADLPFCSTEEDVKRVLEQTNCPFTFSVVDYVDRDAKAAARNMKKKRARQALGELSPTAKRRQSLGLRAEIDASHPPDFLGDASKVFALDAFEEDDDF